MATSATDSDQMDRLSDLSDELLLTILSFLPTHIAARTSVLSRRFCHLWEASPSLELISWDLNDPKSHKFVAMADRAILRRDPTLSLLSLRLNLSVRFSFDETAALSFLSSLLSKARSLRLRHLTIGDFWNSCFIPVLSIIFSITSLDSLSLGHLPSPLFEDFDYSSGAALTRLRSLSLTLLFGTDSVKITRLLSELCSLEDLHLKTSCMRELNLASNTLRKLKLVVSVGAPKFDTLELFLPSLETVHLELIENVPRISGQVPLLAKAKIVLDELHAEDLSNVANLLNFISNVEELSLHIKESEDVKYPIHILFEPKKGMPNFRDLKHLDVTACFHTHNFQAVTTMLHHSPALELLKLVHEVPEFTYEARGRKRKDWGSKLPRNADGNYCYAHFRNLNLGENRKEFMKWMSKKCTRKRQKMQQELV